MPAITAALPARMLATTLCTAMLAAHAPGCFAAEDRREEAAQDLSEVQVTGSRILRPDFVSPNPVTTLDAEALERLGIHNVGDAILQLPQNVSQVAPANTGGSAFYIGSTLANLRGLNPFFGTRTLTLVDGRRFIPTTQGDAVDLNFVPSNMVKRIDTVTGGASAAYGSGAIAGVVNILLDNHLQGVQLDADHGITARGDGGNSRLGIAAGSDFASGRGHVVVGGEWQDMQAIQSCADARGWCGKGVGLYTNTTGFSGGAGVGFPPNINDLPHFVKFSGLRQNQLSRGGVVFNGATNASSTFAFDDAGTGVTPFAIGLQGWMNPTGLVQGGDGERAYTNLTLQPSVQRLTAFSHGEYALTGGVTAYAELSRGKVDGLNRQFEPGQNSAANCIHTDNAYLATLSQAGRNALTARIDNYPTATLPNETCNGGTILLKDWQGQNRQVVDTSTKVTRAVLGFNGQMSKDWSWDAYYQYGRTTRDQIGSGYRSNWRYSLAIDSVIDNRTGSPTIGQPVCRSDIAGAPAGTDFDPILLAGCRPLNPFGTGTASAQALDYAFGSLTEHNLIRQDVLALSTSGKLADGWAGPVVAAFGAEWRKARLFNDAGDLATPLRTDFGLQYGDSFTGSTKVLEGFAEVEAPLLAGIPAIRQLTFNAALRGAQYKTSGTTGNAVGGSSKTSITNWKLASVWDSTDWLRLRGSWSRDLRAPNFRELFYSQTIPAGSLFGSVINPWVTGEPAGPGQNADATDWLLVGTTNLQAEKSKTATTGIVLQPTGALQGLLFSTDYYRIRIKGGLALSLGGPAAVTACHDTGDEFMCSLLTFGPVRPGQEGRPDAQYTNITSMKSLYQNQNPYTASGLDFAFNYRLPTTWFGSLPGQFAVSAMATHVISQRATVTGAGFVPIQADVAGQTGGDSGFLSDIAPAASWNGELQLSYLVGPLTATLQARWIGKGHMDLQNPKTGPDDTGYDPALSYSTSDNTTPAYCVANLAGSYDLKAFNLKRFQVFAAIDNLLDRDPPFATGAVGGTNPINYDTLGRSYRMGLRLKF